MQWYKRSGKQVSQSEVASAKSSHVLAKRTGNMGPISCSVQADVADRLESMSLEEWCRYTGQYTSKPD